MSPGPPRRSPSLPRATILDAFDAEIENDAFEGSPTLHLDRLFEDGDTVVVIGGGNVARKGGGTLEFVFCELFTFRGDLVSRLETYHINLD
jgi:ketosteroid isomerase-like protein